MPANPETFFIELNNGNRVEVRHNGGPGNHWLSTVDGDHLVVEDVDAHGAPVWNFGAVDIFGNVVPTGVDVESSEPPMVLRQVTQMAPNSLFGELFREFDGHEESVEDQQDFIRLLNAVRPMGLNLNAQRMPPAKVRNFVLLMRFADEREHTAITRADIAALMNHPGGKVCLERTNGQCSCNPKAPSGCVAPTGSVKDYYLEASNNRFELDSYVTDWVDISDTRVAAAAGASGLTSRVHQPIIEALNAIDAEVDFTQFDADGDGAIDAFTVIHSGYAAEHSGAKNKDYIWSHKWGFPTWTSNEGVRISRYNINPSRWGGWSSASEEISRIGVIAHETAHFFGLPDLYSYENDGSGPSTLDLMSNPWGVGGSQLYPPLMSAWSRMKLGWAQVEELDAPGEYEVEAAHLRSHAYRISQGYADGEYILIENRRPAGFDALLPNGGIVIYHIDDSADQRFAYSPGRDPAKHYKVAVIQADGDFDFEHARFASVEAEDYWSASSGGVLNDTSVANLNAYRNIAGNPLVCTGHELDSFSAVGDAMTFRYQRHEGCPEASCVARPSSYSFEQRDLTLRSAGPDVATYRFTVTNNDSIDCASRSYNFFAQRTPGLSFEFAPSTLELAPGESASVVLRVRADLARSPYLFAVYSDDQNLGTLSLSIERPVCDPQDFEFVWTQQHVEPAPGDKARLSFEIRNHNVDECKIAFRLSASATRFSPKLSSNKFTLNSGESRLVTVEIGLPRKARVGNTSVISIRNNGVAFADEGSLVVTK